MDYPQEAEHHGLLRETVRRFVETEVPRELARQWDRDNEIDRGVLYKLADLGLFGITIPEQYGGSGRDITATMIVIEELCRRSTALGSGYIYGACYAGMNLVDTASEAQRQEWLPKVARGEMLFSYGLTEPDVGSDLASVTTTAVRDGDVVRINGAKRFCSGTTYTDYIYALVNSNPDGERYHNLSFVLIPPPAAGGDHRAPARHGPQGVDDHRCHLQRCGGAREQHRGRR